jgi:hypothetical protein
MGYKVLGYMVWQGGKWYIRRRVSGGLRKSLALGGLGAAIAGGAVLAQRAGRSQAGS